MKKAWAKATSTHPQTQRRISRLCDQARSQGQAEEAIMEAAKGKIEVSEANDIPYTTLRKMVVGL